MEKKTDRRTLKTDKALRNALAELLSKKPLQKITVQEVSDKADVNRVTFYKHYYDIYALYDQLEKDILTELGLLMLRYQEASSKDFYTGLTDYIECNAPIFRMIFSPHATGEIRTKFSKMTEGVLRLMMTEKYGTTINDSRLEYYSAYHTQGIIAIFEKWVLEGFSKPKDFVIETISSIDGFSEKVLSAPHKR